MCADSSQGNSEASENAQGYCFGTLNWQERFQALFLKVPLLISQGGAEERKRANLTKAKGSGARREEWGIGNNFICPSFICRHQWLIMLVSTSWKASPAEQASTEGSGASQLAFLSWSVGNLTCWHYQLVTPLLGAYPFCIILLWPHRKRTINPNRRHCYPSSIFFALLQPLQSLPSSKLYCRVREPL